MDDKELSGLIDRYAELRPLVSEQKTLAKKIRDEMQVRKIESFTTKKDNTAALEKKPTCSWMIDELKKVLPRAVFELLCPRKPETKKLDQRLAAMVSKAERNELARCRMPGSPKVQLSITGPDGAAEEDEDE